MSNILSLLTPLSKKDQEKMFPWLGELYKAYNEKDIVSLRRLIRLHPSLSVFSLPYNTMVERSSQLAKAELEDYVIVAHKVEDTDPIHRPDNEVTDIGFAYVPVRKLSTDFGDYIIIDKFKSPVPKEELDRIRTAYKEKNIQELRKIVEKYSRLLTARMTGSPGVDIDLIFKGAKENSEQKTEYVVTSPSINPFGFTIYYTTVPASNQMVLWKFKEGKLIEEAAVSHLLTPYNMKKAVEKWLTLPVSEQPKDFARAFIHAKNMTTKHPDHTFYIVRYSHPESRRDYFDVTIENIDEYTTPILKFKNGEMSWLI